MQYRQLGASSLQVSTAGFGCMSLKGEYKNVSKILNAATDGGINYFDTADIYGDGQNEINIGKALRPVRKKILIATKGGNQPNPDGKTWSWNAGKAYILKACESSLKRLQTDYIDLYQLHGGTIDDPIDDTIEALETLQQQGKIRYYGISSIRPDVIREYVNRSNMVSVMMQYSLADRRPEETCLPLLQKHHIGVLARGSVASGLLINKPAKDYLDYTKEQVAVMANAIKTVTTGGRTPAQTAARFVLENNAVTAAVVGISTMAHLQEAIRISDTTMLTGQEMEYLKNVLPVNVYSDHRA